MRYVGALFAGFAAYYLARGIGIPTWTAFTPDASRIDTRAERAESQTAIALS